MALFNIMNAPCQMKGDRYFLTCFLWFSVQTGGHVTLFKEFDQYDVPEVTKAGQGTGKVYQVAVSNCHF